MTKVILDAAIRARLNDLSELLEVCDESGRTLGYFHPIVGPGDSGGGKVRSPYTDEQIERLRQERSGRPLVEILKDLNQS